MPITVTINKHTDMKRRDFLTYASTVPFIGAFLPKAVEAMPAPAQVTAGTPRVVLRTHYPTIRRWTNVGYIEPEGGAIRFCRLFLRMDYSKPRTHYIKDAFEDCAHTLSGEVYDTSSEVIDEHPEVFYLFDTFTRLLNHDRVDKPTFVPTGISLPTGKIDEVVVAVEVAKKTWISRNAGGWAIPSAGMPLLQLLDEF